MTVVEAFDRSAWSALEVGIPVDEIEPMKRFYCDGLGFRPMGHVDFPLVHIEAMRFGNCLLKLTLFLDVNRRPKPRHPDPLACYITLRVSALDQLVERCMSLGAALIVPITSFQTNDSKVGRFAFFSDPIGTRVELVEGDAWSS